ncbi:MAG: hypothetical protein WCA64_06125 [Gallionella sp.]
MPKGRKPDNLDSLPYTVAEIRLKIRRRTGDKNPKLAGRGQGKSTKIVMRDIALLARMTKQNLYRFISGKRQTGLTVLRRLCDVIALVDGGYVQKIKYGEYIIHDEPFTQPVREMRVHIDLAGGQISLTHGQRTPEPARMPSFENIFGSKK